MKSARNVFVLLMLTGIMVILTGCQAINVSADQIEAPDITCNSPDPIRFDSSITVTISSSTTGVTIYYTLDGSDPSNSKTLYSTLTGGGTGPFLISATTKVRAIVYKDSYSPSPIGEETFHKVWTTKTSIPTARRGAAIVTLDDRIIVIGGWDGTNYLSNVEEYIFSGENIAGSWQSKQPLQTPRAFAAAAILDGKIYVFGGMNPTYLYSVEEYTYGAGVGGGSWIYKANFPYNSISESQQDVARAYTSASSLNNKIYLTGGYAYSAGHIYFDKIEAFTPAAGLNAGSWESCTPLDTARYQHGTATIGSQLYIIGGSTPSITKTVECFTPGTGISYATSLNTARSRFAVCTINNNIYVIGGFDAVNQLASIEIFSISPTPQWNYDTLFPLPTGRSFSGTTNLFSLPNNLVFIVGGQTSTYTVTNSFIQYYPAQ